MANTTEHGTEVQLIANLVVIRPDGRVRMTKYVEDDDRWWLPGADLEDYEHPDDAAGRALLDLGLDSASPAPSLAFVESFRGRRGWHVVFHYRLDIGDEAAPGDWFPADDLPPTAHRPWEQRAVARVLGRD